MITRATFDEQRANFLLKELDALLQNVQVIPDGRLAGAVYSAANSQNAIWPHPSDIRLCSIGVKHERFLDQYENTAANA